MPTKAQCVAKDPNPRVVFLSCVHDEPFSVRIRDILRGKLQGRFDDRDRPIEVSDSRDRLSGEEAAVVPWEKTPTDVIVLLSDEYVPKCVGKHQIAANETRPELNFVLRNQHSQQPVPYQVWFGLVQKSRWRTVWIEGRKLDDFSRVLHSLRPNYQEFCNDPDKVGVLDTESADAAELIFRHDSSGCLNCIAPSDSTPMASLAPPSAGFFKRLFQRKG